MKHIPDQHAMNKFSKGESFWRALYSDRPAIYEWDCDWILLPKKGLKQLHLMCPNGRVGVIASQSEMAGRIFQFKIAEMNSRSGRRLEAQVIGIEKGVGDGDCVCWSWEHQISESIFFPGSKPTIEAIRALISLEKTDPELWVVSSFATSQRDEAEGWTIGIIRQARLVGPFEDNVKPGEFKYGGPATSTLAIDNISIPVGAK